MLVQKLRYRHRLYPAAGQPIALAQAFGWARVAWNDAPTLSNRLHREGQQYPDGGKLQKLCITQAKWTPERSWLADASNIPLAQSVRDLDKASRHWCSSPKGKHKGKVRAPRIQETQQQPKHPFHQGRILG